MLCCWISIFEVVTPHACRAAKEGRAIFSRSENWGNGRTSVRNFRSFSPTSSSPSSLFRTPFITPTFVCRPSVNCSRYVYFLCWGVGRRGNWKSYYNTLIATTADFWKIALVTLSPAHPTEKKEKRRIPIWNGYLLTIPESSPLCIFSQTAGMENSAFLLLPLLLYWDEIPAVTSGKERAKCNMSYVSTVVPHSFSPQKKEKKKKKNLVFLRESVVFGSGVRGPLLQ